MTIVIIEGERQVGKTSLLAETIKKYGGVMICGTLACSRRVRSKYNIKTVFADKSIVDKRLLYGHNIIACDEIDTAFVYSIISDFAIHISDIVLLISLQCNQHQGFIKYLSLEFKNVTTYRFEQFNELEYFLIKDQISDIIRNSKYESEK